MKKVIALILLFASYGSFSQGNKDFQGLNAVGMKYAILYYNIGEGALNSSYIRVTYSNEKPDQEDLTNKFNLALDTMSSFDLNKTLMSCFKYLNTKGYVLQSSLMNSHNQAIRTQYSYQEYIFIKPEK